MSKKNNLKFSMSDYLEDVKIAPILCIRCEQPIDVATQPNGWLHLACEKVQPEAVAESAPPTE